MVSPAGPTAINFLEIGTCDFHALATSGTPPGMSVDMVGYLQDRLLDRLFKTALANVTRVTAAVISESSLRAGLRNVVYFFVHADDIETHKLPFTWKGCNSIGAPLGEVNRGLRIRQLLHLLRNASVPTTSYPRLTERFTDIGYVKLDMEGSEPAVLHDLVATCKERALCPQRVRFERIHMKHNRSAALTSVDAALKSVGYRLDMCSMLDCRYSRRASFPPKCRTLSHPGFAVCGADGTVIT